MYEKIIEKGLETVTSENIVKLCAVVGVVACVDLTLKASAPIINAIANKIDNLKDIKQNADGSTILNF
ncbi:hypothetical protein [Pelosinus sp. UFO1]|uniref:hypothetical protein n=1 Tax=Pelosinus sp. UFO1 TaxID=484770 RepID=UPI0004D0C6EA|nr:hypothetical protein [Pelosinus sp. UFO1]AIF54158.1 hypothetical protein UFO1_4623 [Pelosinus sp. UFO1]